MLFNSVDFLVFFPIVIMVYYVIPCRFRNIWLLVASYYFYMCWNAKYAILILGSTLVTYISGLIIERIKRTNWNEPKKRVVKKIVVACCFGMSISILTYYKYTNFLVAILGKLLGLIHVQLDIPQFDIVLPVGISFYTFQALSYTMDVYREEIYAEKNFVKYALFVSFFPQLVAGPIERSKNLLKQLSSSRACDFAMAKEGLLLILWGYFLKIVIADRIAIFVNTVYGDYYQYSGGYIVVATFLFAFQIYCDFYGYSTIAMGTAKILGIQLMENFNAPYLATTVSVFWRRWHISLTSWFKDYLYIPLGGGEKGAIRKYVNKIVVFLVSGLWHGASFSFVVWGGLNGIYQVVGEVLQPFRNCIVSRLRLNRKSIGHKLIKLVITFVLIDFSWIFFRAESTRDAFSIIKVMITTYNPWIFFDGSLFLCGLNQKNMNLLVISMLILLLADICKLRGVVIRKVIMQQDSWCQVLVVTFSVLFILLYGVWGSGYSAANFIYFQF